MRGVLGLAPYVNPFDKQGLVSMLAGAGFTVDQAWQPTQESVFVVAKKEDGGAVPGAADAR